MNNFWRKLSFLLRFSVLLSVFLVACTTTYTKSKSDSSFANGAPVQSSDSNRAEIRMQLGISYLQQDQLATALKELNNALSINPNLSDAYGVRALVYMQMHEDQKAEQDFLKVAKMAPENLDNVNNYAWFLCMNGRESEAMGMFDRVIKDRKYAQPVKALNNAGLCSLKMKDDVLAESYFVQSARIDANNPTTNLNLARINYKKQDWTKAQLYINRIMKEDAYTPEIVWLGMRINQKLNDKMAVASLANQLRRRYPDSKEYQLFQQGAFDE